MSPASSPHPPPASPTSAPAIPAKPQNRKAACVEAKIAWSSGRSFEEGTAESNSLPRRHGDTEMFLKFRSRDSELHPQFQNASARITQKGGAPLRASVSFVVKERRSL